ncbi:ABC transporter permease [Alteromonas facilis]|uniref:ABC transporter permease n=1 Tax=Alteromonas facilis TaxID=2048004 RepID=UPI000C286260|nr:FtsX-like permease family protein [Alteromonas facilis]
MLTDTLRLAWQLHQQEKRYSTNLVQRVLQVVLMVFITTLSLSSASIQHYLTQNLNNLLGADVVISQRHAMTPQQRNELSEFAEKLIYTQTINTTLRHEDHWQRVSLKAVGDGYPLQGELRISPELVGNAVSTDKIPNPGEIWLDSRAIASLSVDVGDQLLIANKPFIVSNVLLHEPDRLMEGHNVDMRAMINRVDLHYIDIEDDSVQYRYLAKADQANIDNILKWQKQTLPAAHTLHKTGKHPLALFWQRTENFLGLTSIILFFMAAIAIHQLSQVSMHKEQYFTAVCMSLGSSRSAGLRISIVKWVLGFLLLIPWVLVIASACHWLVIQWLASTFAQISWHFNVLSLATPILASAAIFAIFQLPVWLALRQSSVRQLVNIDMHKGRVFLSLGCTILVLVGVAGSYSDNGLLTFMVLGAMGACVLLILLSSWVGLTFGEKLTKRFSGLLPFTLYMMKQRLIAKTTQIMGVGLCAFLLLFTLMLLRDIGDTMEGYQRQHDGNLMVSQATDEQMRDIRNWVASRPAEIRQSKPFVYAKLIEINDLSLDNFTDRPSGSLSTLQRPIRLHWTDSVPNNNRVIDGLWWEAEADNWQQVSVEEEVMTDLGLKLGDQLTFFIAEQRVNLTIVASHAYKPGAGSITFWMQMPSTAISHIQAPHYTMASLEISHELFNELGELWQKHPSLRMVSMQEITQRFDNTLAMVTQVVSGFSFLIIILATIVIVSSVNALEAKEKQKNSIIMSFGLSRKTCYYLNVIEWLVTGGIAGVGAIIGTWIAGSMIYQSQFSLHYQPDFIWLVSTLALILLAVLSLGLVASRSSLKTSIRALMAE